MSTLLENEAGMQGQRGKQVILVVVQGEEASTGRKDWGPIRKMAGSSLGVFGVFPKM